MMLSLAWLIVFGLTGGLLFRLFRLPPLLGMLLAGVLIGPQGLDLLDDALLTISGDLRKIALIIILLRAGLGLQTEVVKKIGRPALALAFIPVLLEGFTVALMAMWLFGFTFAQGGIVGFIVAAVSPAVVVPSMLVLMKQRFGEKKQLPAMALASASIDDVTAITMFSMFMSLYLASDVNVVAQIFSVPLAIALGILSGLLIGWLLMWGFKRFRIRDSKKVIILLAVGILMVASAEAIEHVVRIAALLGVMVVALVIVWQKPLLGERLSIKFDKVWVLAEVVLFVLVGAAVDIFVAQSVLLTGSVIVLSGLAVRTGGVFLATVRLDATPKEKAFLAFAFLPKATVQAAIGSLPLTAGVAGGEKILAVSVLAILISAPLGAIAIDTLSRKLLGPPNRA